MAKLIAKTYGNALFELAGEEGKTEAFMSEFTFIRDAFLLNPELFRFMDHPKILKEEKALVIKNIFKDRVSDEIIGFLELLIVKDRFLEFEAIYDYFVSAVKASLGIGVAFVTTTDLLNEIQKAEIMERLIAVTEFKKVEMNFDVDETLIGGMVIRIGDRVVDSSVKTNLSNLKKKLLNV